MKIAKSTTGLKLIALTGALFLGMATALAQQEIDPDHFDETPAKHPTTQAKTHTPNPQSRKASQTKHAQARKNPRQTKKSQPKTVAETNTHP